MIVIEEAVAEGCLTDTKPLIDTINAAAQTATEGSNASEISDG